MTKPDFVIQSRASILEAMSLVLEKLKLSELTAEQREELERWQLAYESARGALLWVLEKEKWPESLTVAAFEQFKKRVEG